MYEAKQILLREGEVTFDDLVALIGSTVSRPVLASIVLIAFPDGRDPPLGYRALFASDLSLTGLPK